MAKQLTVQRLFVYGSLAPRGENHHWLQGLRGRWEKAETRGTLVRICSGPDTGYLALRPASEDDKESERVTGWCFSSRQLAGFWPQLDRFEGDNYIRKEVPVLVRNVVRNAQSTAAKAEAVSAFAYFLKQAEPESPLMSSPLTRAVRRPNRTRKRR